MNEDKNSTLNITKQKNWWRPIWSGLVNDSTGKHSLELGQSIWLLLYLLINADMKTGILVKTCYKISQEMGRKQGTVKKWMRVLKRKGYIQTQRVSHTHFIRINRYKTFKGANQHPIRELNGTYKGCQLEPNKRGYELPNNAYFTSENPENNNHDDIIDNKKINKKIDNYIYSQTFKEKEFVPETKEELLALDIAKGLEDIKGLKYYLSICKKYPEPFIRRIYSQVKELPDEKVKNRGALFNHLIQKLCTN